MIGPDDLLARSGHARVLVSHSVPRSNIMLPLFWCRWQPSIWVHCETAKALRARPRWNLRSYGYSGAICVHGPIG